MGFPSEKELARVRKKLEKVDGTLALRPNASSLEKFRWELHQKFVIYLLEHKLTQRKLAERLEIDESKMSKILRHRLDEFSTDRLITLYQKINPKLKLKVS